MIATDRRGTLMHCTRAACTDTGDLSGVASRGFRLDVTVYVLKIASGIIGDERRWRTMSCMVLLILFMLPLAPIKNH
ncbi:hypothetical protein [Nitrosospira briensis]|uniref:hypothetical protein n=1 Tax=Nitrosospira briensis TaxID=35799 RepID=UPI000468AF3E|nr:hypothetical protein [Nitrosospira briensis]